jgi:HEAT repeat protein
MQNPAERRESAASDVREEFATLKRQSQQKMHEQRPALLAEALLEAFARYDPLFRNLYTAAALTILGEAGNPQDAEIVRAHLHEEDHSVQLQAVRAIGRVGDATDAAVLLAIVKEAKWEIRRAAAESALRLAADPKPVLAALFESSSKDVLHVATEFLIEHSTGRAAEFAEPLLANDDTRKRNAAIRVILETYDEDRAEALLEDYLRRDSYYYNVVCWFDRYLYSPAALRALYRTKLRALTT